MFIQKEKEVILKPEEKYLTHMEIKHNSKIISAWLSYNPSIDITYITYDENYGSIELGKIITETYRFIEERNPNAGIPKSFYLRTT